MIFVAATFLMVFVIEHTQNRERAALHTKLDAIIRALDADTSTVGASRSSHKRRSRTSAIAVARERRGHAFGARRPSRRR